MMRPPARPRTPRRDRAASVHGDLPSVVPRRELLKVSNQDALASSKQELAEAFDELRSGLCHDLRLELREEVAFLKYHLEDRIKPILDIVSLTSSRMELFSEGLRGLKAELPRVEDLKAELPSQETWEDIHKCVKRTDGDMGEIMDILKDDLPKHDAVDSIEQCVTRTEEAICNLGQALPSADAVDSILAEVKRSGSQMEETLCSLKQELPSGHALYSSLEEVKRILLKLESRSEEPAQPTRSDFPDQTTNPDVTCVFATQVEELIRAKGLVDLQSVRHTVQETLQTEFQGYLHAIDSRVGDVAAAIDRLHDQTVSGERASRPSEFPACRPAQTSGTLNGGDASASLPPVDRNASTNSENLKQPEADVFNFSTGITLGTGEAECSSEAKPPVPLQDEFSPRLQLPAQANSMPSTNQNSSAAGGMLEPPDFRASKSPNGKRQVADLSVASSSPLQPPDFKQILKSADDSSPQPSERHDVGQEKTQGSPVSLNSPAGSSPLDTSKGLGLGGSAIRTDSRQEPGIVLSAPSECDIMATIDSEATQPSTHSSPALGTGAEKQNRHADPFGEAELPLKPPEFRKRRPRGAM